MLYFSIHRYEHGTFWPNLRESDFDYVGTGKGEGYNFNVPLNKTGMTNGDYLAIWQQLLLPVATEVSKQASKRVFFQSYRPTETGEPTKCVLERRFACAISLGPA